MMSKVYVVLQKRQDQCGAVDAMVLGITHSLSKAQSILQEERTEILANCRDTIDEMKDDDAYVVEDDSEHFYLADVFAGQWDEIDIIEKLLED